MVAAERRSSGNDGIVKAAKNTTARSGDDLGHSSRRVDDAGRCLRKKSLVVVLVPVDHEVDIRIVHYLP